MWKKNGLKPFKSVWNLRFGKFVLNKYRSENDDKKIFSRNFEISLVESHYYFVLFYFEPKFSNEK